MDLALYNMITGQLRLNFAIVRGNGAHLLDVYEVKDLLLDVPERALAEQRLAPEDRLAGGDLARRRTGSTSAPVNGRQRRQRRTIGWDMSE